MALHYMGIRLTKRYVIASIGLLIIFLWAITPNRPIYGPYNLYSQLYSSTKNGRFVYEIERQFPIAFSLVIYTHWDRFFRLLKSIYRPSNFYCIHVDKSTNTFYYLRVLFFTSQLGPNIHVIPNHERIYVNWAQISVLDVELLCARKLLALSTKWKYWINLTGHEFPLRTNWELIEALKALNGSNIAKPDRFQRMTERIPSSGSLSFNISWLEGSLHLALRREFVQFILESPKALELLNVLRKKDADLMGSVPDEQYFVILNNHPDIFPAPGVSSERFNGTSSYPLFTRYKVWITDNINTCQSQYYLRNICLFGLKDVPLLMTRFEFFANKFMPYFEPVAYDLLERWIQTKHLYELQNGKLHPSFNRHFYTQYDITWKHL